MENVIRNRKHAALHSPVRRICVAVQTPVLKALCAEERI